MNVIWFAWVFLLKDDKILMIKKKYNESDFLREIPTISLLSENTFFDDIKSSLKKNLWIEINKFKEIKIIVNKKWDNLYIFQYSICKNWDWFLVNNNVEEYERLTRFSLNSLPKNTTDTIKQAVLLYWKNENYLEI